MLILGSCGQAPLPRQRGGAVASGLDLVLVLAADRRGLLQAVARRSEDYSGGKPSGDHPSSCAPQPVELPMERAGPSKRSVPASILGAPPNDQMSIAASEV